MLTATIDTTPNTTVTVDSWEQRVFLNADHFRVHRFYGHGQHDSARVPDFLSALRMVGAELMLERRVLIYAITVSGHSVAIPQKLWGEYLKLWKEKHQ